MSKHFKISIVKSCIRITGAIFSLFLLSLNDIRLTCITIAVTILLSEILGIYEEMKEEL